MPFQLQLSFTIELLLALLLCYILYKILFFLRVIRKIGNIKIKIKINKLYTNFVAIFLVYLFNHLAL